MNVAIIPARGGSKRIPRKNIQLFHNKPIIAYSIEVALNSGCFDRVIVSTDDAEIAAVAISYGAEVPFIRPDNIADDFATTIAVMQHAIAKLALPEESNICCLYATAPFISVEQITAGLVLLCAEELDYVFSAVEFSFPIQRAFRIIENGRVEMLHPELFNTRSQDLEQTFHDAGQFYWGSYSAFVAGRSFFSQQSKPIVLPASQVQDIDTPEDWKRAELMYKINQEMKLF